MNFYCKTSLVITALLLFAAQGLYAQTSLEEINLAYGPHTVGFRHYTSHDHSRTYSRVYDYSNEVVSRPIPVSMWYPSATIAGTEEPLTILDYFQILKEEEEWEYLPDEQLLNWFYYANTPENQAHLEEQTRAYKDTEFAEGKFPVIVYAPSFQASSIENFALCEYLASHGYVVIASPSRGTETRWFSNNFAKEIETQSRDMEFLLSRIVEVPVSNQDRIAVVGFSFGGFSNVIAQMRNERISAVISLDGTERYQYELLAKSPSFDIEKMDVPYLHMAQKDIPEKVLEEDNIDPALNTKFQLFDSLTRSSAYRLKMHDLTHAYFSTLGVLFQQRDPRQDKSDEAIMQSYEIVSQYALNFLRAYLKDDAEAKAFMDCNPAQNGISSNLVTYQHKQAQESLFSFQDFNDLVANQNYEELKTLYDELKSKHPGLELPEGNLNTLGLQLTFNPESSSQGIRVLVFAAQLYPESSNLFDSLAEAYLFIGDKNMAIENFKKSLDLYDQNQNAKNRLKELEEL